jgi:hypothetical protein
VPDQPVGIGRPDVDRSLLGPKQNAPPPVPVVLDGPSLAAGLHTLTCPQCGLNPAGPPVARTFQYIPPWVYVGLVFRGFGLLILYLIGRRRVKATLTLCGDCDRADKRARRIRGLSMFGVVLLPALASTALFLDTVVGGIAVGAAAVAGAIATVVAHTRTRSDVIACKKIEGKPQRVTLTAAPSFRRIVAAEAPAALAGPVP